METKHYPNLNLNLTLILTTDPQNHLFSNMDAAFVPSCTTCPQLTLVSSLKSVLESIPSRTRTHTHQLIPPHKLYLHVNSLCAARDEARTSPLRFKWKSQRPLYVPQPCLHSIRSFEAAGCSSPQSHVFYSNRFIFDSLTTVTQTKRAVYSHRLISNIYLRGSSQLKLPASPTAFFQIQKSCYNSSRSQDGWFNDLDKMSSGIGSRELRFRAALISRFTDKIYSSGNVSSKNQSFQLLKCQYLLVFLHFYCSKLNIFGF